MTAMNTQTDKSTFLLPTIAFIAVLLFCIAGFARFLGWLPNSIFYFGNGRPIEVLSEAAAEPVAIAPSHAPGGAGSKARCPECGVIVSIREIGASGVNASHGAVRPTLASDETGSRGVAARGYELKVRLLGGAHRVIVDANSANWRVGERVIFIDGTNAAQP